MENVEKITDVFKKLRDQLMNMEYEDTIETDPDEEEDENVTAAKELLAQLAAEEEAKKKNAGKKTEL